MGTGDGLQRTTACALVAAALTVTSLRQVVSGTLLTVEAGKTFILGDQSESNCNAILIRVVMGWLALFGVLLVLTELEFKPVLTQFHVLAYRSARAVLALFAATICIAASPSQAWQSTPLPPPSSSSSPPPS